jgi:S-DNA-T family DNA segregation ATPase FtsK/SpoIIIE
MTVTAPRPPELPPPHRVPIVATIAPLVVSLVLFAVTRSAFTLVFAALGPVVAVASSVDAALQRRRTLRRETTRFESDVTRVSAEIAAAHDRERRAATTVSARDVLRRPAIAVQNWRTGGDITVTLGAGAVPSELRYEASAAGSILPATLPLALTAAEKLDELRRTASVLDNAPVERRLMVGVGVAGGVLLTASIVRSIVIQLAAALSPRDWLIEVPPHPEAWLALLPHDVVRVIGDNELGFRHGAERIRVVWGSALTDIPIGLEVTLEVAADGIARLDGVVLRPDLLSREEATLAAERLAHVASGAGFTRVEGAGLPDAIELRSVRGETVSLADLAAGVGVSASGTLALDLVTDGPHAIVGGTTGSGKSELLLSWVLGIAAERSPDTVNFLFVDFKGGASFGALVDLPHSVGVITDLDATQAHRALVSLAAELRRRERDLAARGLRGIDDAGDHPFPRLVVVVDEYAALVETFPALHPVFADIAARGRSLGVHLILCTQRPAGVVRDGILANCALRISLRVTSSADSTAVLGTDVAAALPARPLGRAFVSAAGAVPIEFQIARSDAADVENVTQRWRGSNPPRSPWLPPLGAWIPLDALAPDGRTDAIPFAVADRPAEQAQPTVEYRPRDHGSLLVVGSAGSGKSGVLAALLAAPSSIDVVALPTDLPALWDGVNEAIAGHPEPLDGRQRVLLVDDLDSALANCDEAYQAALTERMARLLRDGPSRGIWCVLTAQRVGGALHGLSALCGSLLVLRMPTRAEHALIGADASEFVADLPPGAGHWRGSRIQVAAAERRAPAIAVPRSVRIDAAAGRFAVVSTRPEQFAAALRARASGRRIVPLEPAGFGSRQDALEVTVGDSPAILIGDPDLWQSQWTLFGTLQRGSDILFDGCSLTELRTLLRSRELPPPFAAGAQPLWLRTPDGTLSRATLPAD